MTVYDDVVGWHPDHFVGTTEFYAGFANHRYTVDVPAGWVLVGTGTLQNPQEVLRMEYPIAEHHFPDVDRRNNVWTR